MTTAPLQSLRSPAPVAAAAPSRQGRSLVDYLLVPRPKDLVKAVVAPLAFAVGAATQGGIALDQLGRAALVWVALELLVYQARYQWNDVRGFAADQQHPDAATRGRLPGPADKGAAHITASLAVAALRLGLTGLLALLLPGAAAVIVAMTVGVLGAAAVYERLRSSATGRTAVVPPPARPAMAALWVWVGAGYAVRGMTGLALAVHLGGRWGLAVAAALTMWALGVVFVTCRWALETLSFGRFDEGRLTWEVRRDQAREHTTGLVRWLPTHGPDDGTTEPCAWRALQEPTSLWAPWHLGLTVAAGAAAVTGRLLTGSAGLREVLVLAGAGALVAVLTATLARRPLAGVLVGAAAVLAVHLASGTPRPLVATLPLLVVLGMYACFTHQCADEIGHPLRRLSLLLHR